MSDKQEPLPNQNDSLDPASDMSLKDTQVYEELLKELDRSSRLFQSISETSPDALYVCDLDTGHITYASARSAEIIGYSADEVMALGNRFAATLWHPDDVSRLPEYRRQLQNLKRGEIHEAEYRLVQPTGDYRWLRARTTVLARSDNGEIRQTLSVTQDITESKQTEERLIYHAHLLDNVQDAIVAVDSQLVVTVWNRAAEEMYGWKAEEVLGRDVREVVGAEFDIEQRSDGDQKLAETGYLRTDTIHHRMDGTQINVEGTIVALRNSVGKVSGYLCAYRDITQRKRAVEALHASEERFRRYFELGLIGMAITSPDKGLLEVNDYACEVLGYTRGELLQATWVELTHPDDLADDIANFNRVMAGEIDGYTMDKRWIRQDGQIIHTTISVKCLRRTNGSVDYFVALMQDITARKQAEEALRRAHDELEVEVAERTRELAEANQILQAEVAERKQAQSLQQHLLLQLDSAQENERRRIARELHDSLGQYLTALDIGLKSVQEMEGCTDAVANSLQRLRELAMSMDENVDRLAFELHPRELDDFGLEDTLRRHVQQWSAASGIAVSTHFRGLDHNHLSSFVETTVYRIIQEAMTNILRHAGATRVSLIVERRGTEILAIIEDDGRGFDVEAMQGDRRRLGLQGMTERAALANGKLDIESEPGSGTTVYLHVPIPSESEERV